MDEHEAVITGFRLLREQCAPTVLKLIDVLERTMLAELELNKALRAQAALDEIERTLARHVLRVVS